ncbi:MAG: hypothetical protein MR210_01480 [Erysipelotrichaceae bacterium]|nr:hypothetical protein [Erysipelotrichaceae bacterium]MDY5251881.1 hypothetical protein [Erysipelotrichaceae bacterium]
MRNNISEQNLIDFLSAILSVEGEISLSDFKERVKKSFVLSDYDLSFSATRPNERMYEQRCRNLYCHRNFPSNLISYENQIFRSRF